MVNNFRKPFSFSSQNGVALLAVLACILLLTILIVSFISFTKLNRQSTAEYGNSVQAQEIAEGGMQDILSDLHQEIVAGSITSTNTAVFVVGGTPIYVPTTNLTAVPARLGYPASAWSTDTGTTTFSPSLVRVSRRAPSVGSTSYNPIPSAAAYPGTLPVNRASAASTATPSANGRAISANRWNKTMLLAPYSTVIPTPFTNTPSATTPTGPPDWVYVTRNGSQDCDSIPIANLKPVSSLETTSGSGGTGSPVVGRYAFVMYDEGALLDANVAGSPSSLISTGTIQISASGTSTPDTVSGRTLTFAGKSYESFADLYQLPGLNTAAGQTAINNLVTLRNAGGIASTNYLNSLFQYASYGFTSFVNNGAATPISDTPFQSRQDLINYFAKIDSNINSSSATLSKALPYLGTFSRAVSAPSYVPPIDSSSDPNYHPPATPTLGLANSAPTLYHANAELATVGSNHNPNRDMANVRFGNAGSITHYFDDQSATSTKLTGTYTVAAGDPLSQSRFSLAKINWLSQTWAGKPDPGTTAPGYASSNYPAAIQACFGLVWGPPGSTTTGSGQNSSTANGGFSCWNYVGSPVGPSGTAQVTINGTNAVIETLDQVALEGREPNFFELLKAAILNGSLGLGPGQAAFQNGADNSGGARNAPFDCKNPPGYNYADIVGGGSFFSSTFGPASSVVVPQYIPDIQIMQIGANIIDQYDADSYPTAIYFPYQGVGANDPVSGSLKNAIYGPVDMVYGDENLPLLSKVITVICSPHPANAPNDTYGNGNAGQPSADDNTHSLEGWLQPEIWNPHLQQTYPLASTVPLNYQVRAYGSAMTYAAIGGGYLAPAPSSPTPPNGWSGGMSAPASPNNWSLCNSNIQSYYVGTSSSESPTTGANEEAGTINFTIAGLATSKPAFYQQPYLLVLSSTVTFPPTSVVKGSIPGVASVTSPLPNPSTANAGTTISDVALSTFPYYGQTIGPSEYNNFVAFSAGLISENAGVPPYQPYYVGSTAANTPISPSNAPGSQVGVAFPVTGTGIAGTSFALGWLDSNSKFHPYSFITGAYMQAYLTFYDDAGHTPDGRVGAVCPTQIQMGDINWGLPDPRTGRFMMSGNFIGGGASLNSTIFANNDATSWYTACLTGGIPVVGNFTSPQFNAGNGNCAPEDWMINSPTVMSTQRTGHDVRTSLATPTYYADPDGVVRPADGYYQNVNSGDGMITFESAGTGSTAAGDTAAGAYNGINQHGRRPVILNRPFRSVGELGYVFRDLPFKTLDFFTPSSADAALLDVFSLNDESKVSANAMSSIVAGQVNLSNAPLPVLQAILRGGAKKDFDPTYNLGAEAATIAQSIASSLNASAGPHPLLNRSALVTQLSPIIQSVQTGTITSLFTNPADQSNKAYLESPIRALSDMTNTRTWNLMIDIIAQSGQLSPNAQSLDDFVVQGERRYWLHLAIDRYTGKIVAQQLEPVYE